jgi:hypothetical protein
MRGDEMQDKDVNIERVMDEIREEIRQKGLSDTELSFECVSDDGFMANMERLFAILDEANWRAGVQAYHEVGGGKVKALFKRVVRKLVRFYVEPIVSDQNAFNAAAVTGLRTIGDQLRQTENAAVLAKAVRELRAQNIALKKRIEALEAKHGRAGG